MREETSGSRAKIRALCNELAREHGLEDAAREELCDHMEEKLLDYFSGRVKISEEDALLLVRSHFGDAHQVARQLNEERHAGARVVRWLCGGATSQASQRALLEAVFLLIGFFGIIVPLLSYMARLIWVAHKTTGPVVPLAIVRVSPLVPLLLMGIGVIALLFKERYVSSSMARRMNVAAIVTTIVAGILVCVCLITPVIALMRAIPE